jgi:hypothetical protein
MARVYARYYTEYDIGGVSTDIAVIDLRELEAKLKKPLAALAGKLIGHLEPASAKGSTLMNAIATAHWRAQSYNLDSFVDLRDWVDQLDCALEGHGSDFADVLAASEEVRRGLAAVVRESLYAGPDFQHSHGLSIYFPAAKRRYDPAYEALALACDTRWHDFLKLYLEKSQRELRKEEGAQELYFYEDDGQPPSTGQTPGTVRTPPNGTKRQTPPNGVRVFDGLDGYAKNGPRAWYRDPRVKHTAGADTKGAVAPVG